MVEMCTHVEIYPHCAATNTYKKYTELQGFGEQGLKFYSYIILI